MKKFSISYQTRNFILGLIGCIISTYIIYIRLIWSRPSRELFVDIAQVHIIVYLDLFLIFLFYSLVYLYSAYREIYPPKRKLKNQYLIYIVGEIKYWFYLVGFYFSQTYKYSLIYFDIFIREILIEKCLGQKKFLFNMLDPFRKIFSYQRGKQYTFTIMVFIIVPKLLMLIILFMDIFIFEKFHYFYLAAPIYLIPLTFEYFLYVIKCTASPYYHEYCSILQYIKDSTNEIITVETYVKIKSQCAIPYFKSYHIFNMEKYKLIQDKDISIGFTAAYYQTLTTSNKEIICRMISEKDEFLQYTIVDPIIIVNYCNFAKTLYMEKYKIDLITTLGYTICWGYVFMRSYFIFIT